jgi:prepilin-type N-terminal cleavage/methylation domain-containing protein
MSRRRALLRGQDGFTLIEVMVGALILAIGILATLTVFGSARDLSASAEHQTVMAQRAQNELERIQSLPWNQIALTGTSISWSGTTGDYTYVSDPAGSCPATPSGPAPQYQPDHSGASGTTESLVINGCSYTTTVSGSSQTITPTQGSVAPVTSWSAPLQNGTTQTGSIYDFITWTADPTCSQTSTPGSSCSTTNDYKRVTVVVTIDGITHPSHPLIISGYVTPPNNGHPPNSSAGTTCSQGTQTVSCTNTPPAGQTPSPSFPLCDTSASNSQCTEPTPCTGNTLDDTITGTGAIPDLLGTSQPTGACTTGTPPTPSPPCFATDVGCSGGGGSCPTCGGLPLQPCTTSCATQLGCQTSCITPTGTAPCYSPPSSNSESHSWVTPAIAAGTTWNLTGTGTMTAYLESAQATPINATLCMAVYALPTGLSQPGGLFGNQIGATVSTSVYAAAGVPTPATFDFNVGSGTYAVASTGAARIEVVVWIANSTSAVDLVYDQAQFASQIDFLLQT